MALFALYHVAQLIQLVTRVRHFRSDTHITSARESIFGRKWPVNRIERSALIARSKFVPCWTLTLISNRAQNHGFQGDKEEDITYQ